MDNQDKFTVIVKRDKFRFAMHITKSTDNGFDSYTFEIGKMKPCLKLYIRVPTINDERYIKASETASLLNIESLVECSLDDINENYMRKHGMSHELLDTVDHILKTYFPHVKYITLNDASYLPCNREFDDILDLLTYNIALYGKTWYEIKVDAYLNDPAKQTKYNQEIKKYISEEFKKSFDADAFLIEKIQLSPNKYIQNILKTQYDKIKEQFVKAKTFPEFFKLLRDDIEEKKKCKFFKDWLQSFIGEHITIQRTWQYNVYRKKNNSRSTRKNRLKRN